MQSIQNYDTSRFGSKKLKFSQTYFIYLPNYTTKSNDNVVIAYKYNNRQLLDFENALPGNSSLDKLLLLSLYFTSLTGWSSNFASQWMDH